MPHRIPVEQHYSANNYKPLPVTLVKGQGIYLWDDMGKKYLDMMGAYSAVSHGHCHPALVQTLIDQAQELCITSRAYYSDRLEPFLEYACKLTGQDKALPMNTGAEAVETAIKAARKWGHTVKGIPKDQAEIIVCSGNFHGRTTTIISFSTEPQYQYGFGPLTPGFKVVPYGDAAALAAAITPNTAAFLVEPVQGEAGIRIPPAGYLKQCADICRRNNVLFIADEVQTGLGRTGKLLACQHENIKPDGVILGKALGGGILPVSMFLAKAAVMDVFTPGDHGSTFGGNPLAATVGLKALQVLVEEKLSEHSAELGAYFLQQLQTKLSSSLIKEIRGKGLFIGIEIDTQRVNGRELCIQLIHDSLLTKETHDTVIRLCPPLIVTREQVDEAVHILQHSFKAMEAK